MARTKVPLEVARQCAKSELTPDAQRGGYVCNGCGRHFQRSAVNNHVYAARRRVYDADAVVQP